MSMSSSSSPVVGFHEVASRQDSTTQQRMNDDHKAYDCLLPDTSENSEKFCDRLEHNLKSYMNHGRDTFGTTYMRVDPHRVATRAIQGGWSTKNRPPARFIEFETVNLKPWFAHICNTDPAVTHSLLLLSKLAVDLLSSEI